MINLHRIDSLDHPELRPYRTMRQQTDHQHQGIFVAEGEKVVRRLLESKLTIISVLMPPKWLDGLRPLLGSRPEAIDVYLAEKSILEELTGFSMYQGLLALARVPPSVSLSSILLHTARPRFVVAVDGLATAENLGGLIRNCAAFGVQALIVGETSASPYLRRAVRSSMGTIFQVPVVDVSSLSASLRQLRSHGIRCLAAHPRARQSILSQVDLRKDCCLVFGSEGHGISPEVLEACDLATAIPMQQGVDSLNVGCASAVFLYEVARQRAGGLEP